MERNPRRSRVAARSCRVGAIKPFNTVKRILLISLIVLGFVLVPVDQIPELPSSKPILPGAFGTEIRTYLLETLFSFAFFIASLAVAILIELYGLSMRNNAGSLKTESRVAEILGVFILVSGIWVLTGSRALSIFTTDYGGSLNKNAIISLSFLQYIIPIKKTLWIIEGLFTLNLPTFVAPTIFNLSKELHFLFLILYHVLIYILMILGTIYCIQNLRGTRDKQKIFFPQGMLLFRIFGGDGRSNFTDLFNAADKEMYFDKASRNAKKRRKPA